MKSQNLLTAVVLILAANFLWQLYDIVSMMLRGFFNITFLIRYIPLFLGIAGLVLFATSKFKNSNVLMFYMGISLFMYPFSMSLFFKYILQQPELYGPQVTMDVMQYVRIGFGFLFFLACGFWQKNVQQSFRIMLLVTKHFRSLSLQLRANDFSTG